MVSGDKKGQVAVWDFEKVYERTVHGSMHRALTNNLRFLGPLHDMQCASASSDGLCKVRHQLVHSTLVAGLKERESQRRFLVPSLLCVPLDIHQLGLPSDKPPALMVPELS